MSARVTDNVQREGINTTCVCVNLTQLYSVAMAVWQNIDHIKGQEQLVMKYSLGQHAT
jgi:hypothetical protein